MGYTVKYGERTLLNDVGVDHTLKTAGKLCSDDIEIEFTGGGGKIYSIDPVSLSWQHNTYITIGLDIGADGALTVYKASGGGTMTNPVVCYPQSDTYSADSEISSIPIPQAAGTYTMPITVWWDSQSGVHADHNNHTITYTVIEESGEVTVEPLSVTANGTYSERGKAYSPVTVNVPSSGGMNVQGYHGYAQTNATTLTATAVSLTINKTGTYKISWMGARNNASNTFGSRLYIGNTAYGTENTSFTNTYMQSNVLNNVSLTAGQTITVYARSRSSSYYMMVGNLIAEQTA